MRITADTNILVRAVTEDDPVQSPVAQGLLVGAEIVAMPLPSLCEFCWVVGRGYKFDRVQIAQALRALVNGDNVQTDFAAVEAGLVMLEAGGDFGDGVIAYQGSWLGGETFASFDKKAVELIRSTGASTLIPE